MSDPIAYTYEADTHCPSCAVARFRQPAWAEDDERDSEGNPVGAIFPWDEWCEPSESGTQTLACGTCGRTIEEHVHDPERHSRVRETAVTMRWVADQADYIARLARLPWAGDADNVEGILRELDATVRVLRPTDDEVNES